jgi:catechol 2,3-dioxygenase-like lactoylglutathione lyase family enzyme
MHAMSNPIARSARLVAALLFCAEAGLAPAQAPARAVTVSDGYLGLNINPRKAGRPAGLDHFGVEVEDVERTCARLRERYPAIQVLKRPSTRPFAGISTHDLAGNLFDLSQKDMENRTSVYVEPPREQARAVSHLALRTLHADEVAEFYVDLFGFERLARKAGDPNHCLSDGRITLILMPWSILDYQGGGIARPGPDHIGFRVENLHAVKESLQAVGDNNPHLRPFPLGAGPEGQARLALFQRCPYGAHHLADPDGVLLDLAEK